MSTAGAGLRRAGSTVLHALAWPVRSPMRFLLFVWFLGFLTVGWVQHAAADGIIVGPDLGADGQTLTVFERVGPGSFSFYQRLSESNHGFPYISETMWNMLNLLANIVMFLLATLAQGAITSLQWMLNLALYQDNKIAIDETVQSVAAQVYWPLLGTSLAIGAAVAYGRMKREGNGSLFSDAAWLVATAVFAGAFVLSASNVLNDLDEARTLVSDGMLVGYASTDIASESSAGFPAVELPATTEGATRQLSDAMWNTSVVAPWCYAMFGSLDDCKNVGADYLTQSDRWKQIDKYMEDNRGDDEGRRSQCPPEISHCDWLRGQSAARLGAVMFAAAVSLPQDIVQLGLAIFGIMAIVTFLLLILVGAFFVLLWPIPGKCREIGTKWFMELIGALLQSIIITAVIGAVMVLSGLLTLAIPRYGLFGAAVLQIAVMIAGWRLRGTMENILGVGSGQSSPVSSYVAMKSVGALGRRLSGLTRFGSRTGMKAAGGVFNAAYNSPDTIRRGATAMQNGGARAAQTWRTFRQSTSLPSRPPTSRSSAAPSVEESGSAVAVKERPRIRESSVPVPRSSAGQFTSAAAAPTAAAAGAASSVRRPSSIVDAPPAAQPAGRAAAAPSSRASREPRPAGHTPAGPTPTPTPAPASGADRSARRAPRPQPARSAGQPRSAGDAGTPQPADPARSAGPRHRAPSPTSAPASPPPPRSTQTPPPGSDSTIERTPRPRPNPQAPDPAPPAGRRSRRNRGDQA